MSFYTNYNSSKGREISANPFGALTYHWRYPHNQNSDGETQRQVRLRGRIVKSPLVESQEYFHSRSEESRLGAYASKQSSVLKPHSENDDGRDTLQSRLKDAREKYKGDDIPLPEFWGGYILVPLWVYEGIFWNTLTRLPVRLSSGQADQVGYTTGSFIAVRLNNCSYSFQMTRQVRLRMLIGWLMS